MNLTERRVIDGLAVTVINTRPDIDTEKVLSRLATALGLIRRYTPHYYRHLRRDFAGILVKRYECRGAYLVEPRICLVELTFVVNPGFSEAQVAATILHEAMGGSDLEDAPMMFTFRLDDRETGRSGR